MLVAPLGAEAPHKSYRQGQLRIAFTTPLVLASTQPSPCASIPCAVYPEGPLVEI